MNPLNFLKDFMNHKKLLRINLPSYSWRLYDLRREMTIFWDTPPQDIGKSNNENRYKQLVNVNGFGGRTGSSAIIDFLNEFDDITLPSGTYKGREFFEAEFFTKQGALLSLEESFFSHRFFYSDFGAMKFSIDILNNYFSNIKIYDDYYLERSKKFLFDLIENHWRWSAGEYILFDKKNGELIYNPPKQNQLIAINNPIYNQVIEVIYKKLTLKEYRQKASEYIKDFLENIPSKNILVFSQLLNTGKFEPDLFSEYFGDIKHIYVWRDPRDQYVYYRNKQYRCKPADPYVFISRFKMLANDLFNSKHKKLLIIRFEDFLENYDRISRQIIDFLELDQKKHTRKFKYFNPDISKKNKDWHKYYHDQDAIKVIKHELKEYCIDK